MDSTNHTPRIAIERVVEATGKDWDAWFTLLDREQAVEQSHKEIATLLREKHGVPSWWAQSITVEYEYARGLRKVGQTKDAGYEIGVQATLPLSKSEAWDLLMSPKGRAIWLGDTQGWKSEAKHIYQTADGVTGEVRTIHPGDRIRLTWQPKHFAAPSTLQLTLTCPRNTPNRTTLGFHQEKLASASVREEMRAHWKRVVNTLQEMALKGER